MLTLGVSCGEDFDEKINEDFKIIYDSYDTRLTHIAIRANRYCNLIHILLSITEQV